MLRTVAGFHRIKHRFPLRCIVGFRTLGLASTVSALLGAPVKKGHFPLVVQNGEIMNRHPDVSLVVQRF